MAKNNYINVLLISGSGIIGGLINYLYHPIMLKYLTIEEFGVFGSLLGMFNILGILTVGFVLFLNKEVSKNINDKGKIKFIYYETTKILFFLSVFLYFLYLLFSKNISNFLNINNLELIYMVGLAIIIGFIGVSFNAVLRGLKKFEFLSFVSILAPIFKLILGFILVYLGFKLHGAIIGFILGGFFTLFVSTFYLYRYFKNIKQVGSTIDLINDLKESKKNILNFFFVSLFFAILMNIDVILAKNIFDSRTAGIYAGLSVLGKFLIFLLLSIETVYYGQIMEYEKKQTPSNLIKNPIILLIIVFLSVIVFNYIFGTYILSILKAELVEYRSIYLLMLMYYGLLAFISFFSKILIGWGEYFINYIMGFLSILLIVSVYIFGNSLVNFIYCFIGIGIIGTIMTGTLFFYKKNNG